MSCYQTFCPNFIQNSDKNQSFCPDFNLGTQIVYSLAKLNKNNNRQTTFNDMNLNNLTIKSQEALQQAQQIAQANGQATTGKRAHL